MNMCTRTRTHTHNARTHAHAHTYLQEWHWYSPIRHTRTCRSHHTVPHSHWDWRARPQRDSHTVETDTAAPDSPQACWLCSVLSQTNPEKSPPGEWTQSRTQWWWCWRNTKLTSTVWEQCLAAGSTSLHPSAEQGKEGEVKRQGVHVRFNTTSGWGDVNPTLHHPTMPQVTPYAQELPVYQDERQRRPSVAPLREWEETENVPISAQYICYLSQM